MDDLARRLVPPPGEDITVRQGTIRAWDPETFDNTVEYDGLVVPNVPVASGVEALTYAAGDVVLLEGWFPSGPKGELGIGSFWIRGRAVIPGTGAAEKTIAFMTTTLGSSLAAAVLGARLHKDSVPLIEGLVQDPGSTYVSAPDGPTLTNVEVSDTGLCLLFLTARIACQINQPDGVSAKGFMSFEVSGASTVGPADDESLTHDLFGPAADVIATTVQATRLVLIEGLNPGSHIISARYRSEHIDPPPASSVLFSSRNLTALAL